MTTTITRRSVAELEAALGALDSEERSLIYQGKPTTAIRTKRTELEAQLRDARILEEEREKRFPDEEQQRRIDSLPAHIDDVAVAYGRRQAALAKRDAASAELVASELEFQRAHATHQQAQSRLGRLRTAIDQFQREAKHG